MTQSDCYGCAGYDWKQTCSDCTRRGYEFTFTKAHELDSQRGLWLTCFDADGMEVEVTIKGLDLTMLQAIVAAAELAEKEACSTKATRFSTERDAKEWIKGCLGEFWQDHDIDLIYFWSMAWRIDHDEQGAEILGTGGFQMILNENDWTQLLIKAAK